MRVNPCSGVIRTLVVIFWELNTTILHLLGLDHTQLTFKCQGGYFRLTDVHGEVVRPILT